MKVAVTGASGLLGANLAVALTEAGHQVTCTKRRSSLVSHLDGFELSWVDGDLGDVEALTRAFDGAEIVYHCAASTAIRKQVRAVHASSNTQGTQNVLDAVRSAGVGRLVHTSSVVATGVSTDGNLVNETAEWNFPDVGLVDGYSQSKRDSELLVMEAARQDVDAVVVNPSFMFGPYDAKLSSGRLIVAVAKGHVPGYTDGMSNYVGAADVARGMLLAAERGVRGQRYILGNQNLSYRDVFAMIAGIAGVKAPRRRIPRPLAQLGAWTGDLKQRITGKDADINSTTVAYSYCSGNVYSSAKAIGELGYQPGSLETAIGDSIDWFRSNGIL